MDWTDRQKARLHGRAENYRAIRDGHVPDGMHEAHVAHKIRIALPATLAALARVAQGTYGICVECGEEIPRTRLEAVPATSCCVTCQKEKEKRQ